MIYKYFLPLMDCLFILLIVFFDAKKFLVFLKSYLSIFTFVFYVFGVISNKSLPNPVL